jgi:ubiquitin-protein ligase
MNNLKEKKIKSEKKVYMPMENKKRLAKDVVRIIKNPLTTHGIYYKHDENNMLLGYALIIGPEDTIYENGYYLFKFIYSTEYPYKPPLVKYLTNNGKTRFNPNLYRNGKVCISILNTWKGEQWTSCQNINTVLLTLITLLHNKPLLNEPGISESYKYFNNYNKIINYRNYDTAILNVLNKTINNEPSKVFYPIIKDNFIKNKDKILKKIENSFTFDEKEFYVAIYSMSCKLEYKKIYEKLKNFNFS